MREKWLQSRMQSRIHLLAGFSDICIIDSLLLRTVLSLCTSRRKLFLQSQKIFEED
jgi:hypothetical protein